MANFSQTGEVFDDAVIVWLSHDKSCHVILCYEFFSLSLIHYAILDSDFHKVNTMVVSICLDHTHHGRVECLGDKYLIAFLRICHTHHHSLCRSSRPVIH